MNEFNPIKKEISTAENIRRQYINKIVKTSKELKRLDVRVKTPGFIISILMCIIGILTMTYSMLYLIVFNNLHHGLFLLTIGLLLTHLSYPVYSLITNNRRIKYSSKILDLSEDILLENV